jgi:hypothetical protein
VSALPPTSQEKVEYARELIAKAFAERKKRDRQMCALRAIEVIRAFNLVIVSAESVAISGGSAAQQSIPNL